MDGGMCGELTCPRWKFLLKLERTGRIFLRMSIDLEESILQTVCHLRPNLSKLVSKAM